MTEYTSIWCLDGKWYPVLSRDVNYRVGMEDFKKSIVDITAMNESMVTLQTVPLENHMFSAVILMYKYNLLWQNFKPDRRKILDELIKAGGNDDSWFYAPEEMYFKFLPIGRASYTSQNEIKYILAVESGNASNIRMAGLNIRQNDAYALVKTDFEYKNQFNREFDSIEPLGNYFQHAETKMSQYVVAREETVQKISSLQALYQYIVPKIE